MVVPEPTKSLPAGKPGLASAFLVLIVVALLALLHMRYPLHEDQALFMYVARELADGAQVYREFWDMKQPGIYWWYEAVGRLFGFDAIGLRWMDLLWSLAVAWVLWAAVRSRGTLAAVLAPCLAFGSFYARTHQSHLSQVEWLVGGPIAVVLWCVATAESSGGGRVAWRYLVAGAMVAIVGLFKSIAVLMPLAMLAVAMVLARWKEARPWGALLKECALPVLAGIALVLLPVAAWMQANGTLGVAIWTAVVYPPLAVREYEHNTLVLLAWSFRWFLVGAVALVPWALWGAYNGLRRGLRIELVCLAWSVAALVVICMQVLSYWEYHFDLLFIPTGVLAALGFVDALERFSANERTGYRKAALAVLVLGVAASMGWPLARKATRIVAAMPFTPERQLAFNATLDERWKSFAASADAVRPFAKESDRVVVWGDARLYFLLGRRPLVEVNGSTFYLARQVEEVAALIREKKPPLIFVSKHRNRMTNHGGGVLPQAINEFYKPAYEDETGIWYRLRNGPA